MVVDELDKELLLTPLRSCTEKGHISLLTQILKVCLETAFYYEWNIMIQI